MLQKKGWNKTTDTTKAQEDMLGAYRRSIAVFLQLKMKQTQLLAWIAAALLVLLLFIYSIKNSRRLAAASPKRKRGKNKMIEDDSPADTRAKYEVQERGIGCCHGAHGGGVVCVGQ